MNNQEEPSSSHFNEEEQLNLSPTQLLKLAESHLRLRNFSLSRQYILQSQQSTDPNYAINNHYASQLLTITNILSNPTDYYSILQVPPFCNDLTLIRSQFKHILLLIDPIKDRVFLGNEAFNLVWKAYGCLSAPAKKTQFDSQFVGQRSEKNVKTDVGRFWTFCPYCFYMYEYARVYEGCSLRCQNRGCRRVFHGVPVNSLPKMELDKGVYFACFGYFPLGFSPESECSGKFESWTPIVGMFPVNRIGKTRAGRMSMNDDKGDFIEVLDESDDESGNDHGVGVQGGNVGGINVGNARPKKRKMMALNDGKFMSEGRKNNDGVDGYGGNVEKDECGNQAGSEGGNGGLGDESCVGFDDVAFFEEDGEIFVGLGSDDAL